KSYTSNRTYEIIDSIKTLQIHLTTEPLIFRGKINATVSNISANNPDANVLITKALFVNGANRLTLDTVQLISGTTDTASFIRLRSSIANAQVVGQYRLADLGSIIQS